MRATTAARPASTRPDESVSSKPNGPRSLLRKLLNHRPVLEQPERQRRIDGPPLRRLALEIGDDSLHLLRIQHGQRRAAVRADGVGLDVDGRAAARAGDGAYVLLERGDLGRAQ